ncbi:MAG: helix-hairpin-helix domain-containing protein [Cyclobacteriaceae bacterium]
MKRLRTLIRHYFNFSRRETDGFLVLVPILMLIITSPSLYKQYLISHNTPNEEIEIRDKWLETIALVPNENQDNPQKKYNSDKIKPQPFNPNTASLEELIDLGLSARLSNTILNYRGKGGVFQNKEHLLKIYGMDSALYRQLEQYIVIPIQPSKSPDEKPLFAHKSNSKSTEVILRKANLNAATEEDLRGVYGIGEVLSKRIISFRDALGGFYNLNQLKDVYGLADSTRIRMLEKFSLTDSTVAVRKINLAIATIEEIGKHPYINYKLAKVISEFRKQHDIQTIDQLKDIKLIDDSLFLKISPYLEMKSDSIMNNAAVLK